jgi:hypothetical protein
VEDGWIGLLIMYGMKKLCKRRTMPIKDLMDPVITIQRKEFLVLLVTNMYSTTILINFKQL